MADISQLLVQRARLLEQIAALRQQESDVFRTQRQVNAELRSVKAQILDPNVSAAQKDQLTARGVQLESEYNRLEVQGVRLGEQIARLEAELAQINRQIAQAQTQAGEEKISAGQTALEAQQARDDRANPSVPPTQPPGEIVDAEGRIRPTPSTQLPSNTEPDASPTSGIDAPLRQAEDIQSNPPPTARRPIEPGSASTLPQSGLIQPTVSDPAAPVPGARPGVAAPGDDQTNAVRARINDIFGGGGARIVPQENVLSRYNNYTYNISLYLMSQNDYRRLLNNENVLTGSKLLIQSGGIPINERNQFFPVDFYIDDVRIKSAISGRGTGGAHNSFSMTFKITEPNGVTFINRLVAATQQYVSDQGDPIPQNYAAQNFLMVIRFYGYDEAGNLVDISGNVQSADATTGPSAIVQKFIPFQFTAVKFRMTNSLVTYECEAVCPQNVIASGGARGVIPYNIELTATTLKELLLGNASFSTVRTTSAGNAGRETTVTTANRQADPALTAAVPATASTLSPFSDGLSGTTATTGGGEFFDSAVYQDVIRSQGFLNSTKLPSPPKASAAPTPNIVSGLVEALNRYQQEQVQAGTVEHPDVYEIVIPEEILQNAKMQPPEAAAGLASVPMTQARTAAQAKLGATQSVNRDAKNVSATAGMSIVQFLDQCVRTSTYIYDQQTKIIITDKNGQQRSIPNGVPGNNLAWYRIGMDVEPLRYDQKRRDWTYRIRYSITPYRVNDVKSDYFPKSQFTGVHKSYDYWFTGKNTEVVDYQQDYNYLYYIVVNTSQAQPTLLTNPYEYEKRAFQPRSNESTQGSEGKINEPSASAATNLYSPADTARTKLTILGDPAWLQQGELTTGISNLDKFYYGPFLPDGTINYDSQEILFQVRFISPVDYNLDTGLAKAPTS